MYRVRCGRFLAVIGSLLLAAASLQAEPERPFITGVNYPWIAYGHDFGRNEWGHDGLITGGWSYETYDDSQGLTDSRFSTSQAHSGAGSLRLTADLIGRDGHKQKGEVKIDLRNHTPSGLAVPIDVTNATVSCWLFLPRASAGDAGAPNGVQFFFKSGEKFHPLYTAYQNIRSDQEQQWVRFSADLSDPPAFRHEQFDPAAVISVGVKISIGDGSNAGLAGTIFLDDYVLNTDTAIAFDFERLEVENDFAALQQTLGKCSVPAVRVFVFADGGAAPEFAFDDHVTGLDESVLEDFDALLEAAEKHGLQVIPVVLDFYWLRVPPPLEETGGVQLGGRSNVVRNTARRQAFLDNALRPLVDRYCGNPQILAWDVINEPEWATKEFPEEVPNLDRVALAEMQAFVRAAAETIHSCPGQMVTVGSARRQWLPYWQGLGLDLYQFHWYEKFEPEEPFPWHPYSQLALDKPAIVGEVQTASNDYSARDYLSGAAGGGYDGLLLWSYRLRDEVSEYGNARSMLQDWCGSRPRRRAVRSGVAGFENLAGADGIEAGQRQVRPTLRRGEQR